LAERGFLVIADITGYSAFLNDSELEHAEDSLRDLLDLIVEQTKPPLVISRLEGDAVISYAPEASFLQGQTMVEIIENTYVKFREARQRMRLNTSCDCNACRNIPNLDLKFFVHYGAYILQKITNYTELVGSDVNAVHRLMKNRIKEETGISAYAAYTQAAVDALGIHEFVKEMEEHIEEFPDVGELKLYVEDLVPAWQRESKRRRVFVEPEEASFVLETDFPAEPPLVWDYFMKPEYRSILTGADSIEVDNKKAGRLDEGSVYICAHGDHKTLHAIVDWRPFDYYSYEAQIGPTLKGTFTTRFVPTESGTRVIAMVGRLQGSAFARNKFKLLLGKFVIARQEAIEAFRDFIIQELESGASVRPEASTIPKELVTEAAQASLAKVGAD